MAYEGNLSRGREGKKPEKEKKVVVETSKPIVYVKPKDIDTKKLSSFYRRAPTPEEKHLRKSFNRKFAEVTGLGSLIQISDDEFGIYRGFSRGRLPIDSKTIYVDYSPVKIDIQTAFCFPGEVSIDGINYEISYRRR
ncbi:MAG: hypothetical protein AABW91_02090 [Nanoarchaeota archaeon]